MKFHISSLETKFETLTGEKWSKSGHNTFLIQKLPTVVVDSSSPLAQIRDWCEEHFGNNWIYSWNQFFFLNQEDAVFFTLKWL